MTAARLIALHESDKIPIGSGSFSFCLFAVLMTYSRVDIFRGINKDCNATLLITQPLLCHNVKQIYSYEQLSLWWLFKFVLIQWGKV